MSFTHALQSRHTALVEGPGTSTDRRRPGPQLGGCSGLAGTIPLDLLHAAITTTFGPDGPEVHAEARTYVATSPRGTLYLADRGTAAGTALVPDDIVPVGTLAGATLHCDYLGGPAWYTATVSDGTSGGTRTPPTPAGQYEAMRSSTSVMEHFRLGAPEPGFKEWSAVADAVHDPAVAAFAHRVVGALQLGLVPTLELYLFAYLDADELPFPAPRPSAARVAGLLPRVPLEDGEPFEQLWLRTHLVGAALLWHDHAAMAKALAAQYRRTATDGALDALPTGYHRFHTAATGGRAQLTSTLAAEGGAETVIALAMLVSSPDLAHLAAIECAEVAQ